MRVLVLGAGGMAGHVIAIYLRDAGHTVRGFARRALSFCDTVAGDAMTADLSVVVKGYDAVVNCIGVLNKSVDAEPSKGVWLNSYLPHLLASCAKRTIHISTDCVFSGHEGGGYREDSFRSSDTMYGRSKALGELNDSRNLTIRTSIVGPDVNESGIGLFNWFMKQRGEVYGYTGAIWSGVTSITLAKAIDAALGQGLTGLLHLTNNAAISKFELLRLFNELRREPIEIKSSCAVNNDKSFLCTSSGFDFQVPPYAEMVREMGQWIQTNCELYPQYEIRGQRQG